MKTKEVSLKNLKTIAFPMLLATFEMYAIWYAEDIVFDKILLDAMRKEILDRYSQAKEAANKA